MSRLKRLSSSAHAAWAVKAVPWISGSCTSSARNVRSNDNENHIANSVKKFLAVRYSANNSLPLLPTLSHINPLNTLPSYFSSILILPSNTRLGLSSGSFFSGVFYQISVNIFFHACHVPCPFRSGL